MRTYVCMCVDVDVFGARIYSNNMVGGIFYDTVLLPIMTQLKVAGLLEEMGGEDADFAAGQPSEEGREGKSRGS